MRTWFAPNTVGQVTNWLAEVGDLPTALVMAALGVVMLLDAIPLIGVLIPGDVAVLGAMAARGPAGGVGVLVGVIAGCLAGWSASFLAGRYFGARIRRGRLGAWIGESRWQAAERAVRSSGSRMVMVAPFLPVLNALVPLAAGGLRMSYRRFLGSAAVGGALWAGCYVGLGTLADALSGLLPGESFTALASVLIGLTFGWIVLLSTRRRLAQKPSDNEQVDEGVSIATAGMSMVFRPAGRVRVAQIPGPDCCPAPRFRREPRRRPPRAGVDACGPRRLLRLRTRRRRRRDAAGEGCLAGSNRRLVRPGR